MPATGAWWAPRPGLVRSGALARASAHASGGGQCARASAVLGRSKLSMCTLLRDCFLSLRIPGNLGFNLRLRVKRNADVGTRRGTPDASWPMGPDGGLRARRTSARATWHRDRSHRTLVTGEAEAAQSTTAHPPSLGPQVGPGARGPNPQFPFPRFPIWPGIGEGIPGSRFGQNRESGNPRFPIRPRTGIGVPTAAGRGFGPLPGALALPACHIAEALSQTQLNYPLSWSLAPYAPSCGRAMHLT